MGAITLPSRAVVSYLVSALFALLAALHIVLPASFSEPSFVAAVMLGLAAVSAVVRFMRAGDAGADAKNWYQSRTIWTAIVSAVFAGAALFGAVPDIDQGNVVAFVLLAVSLVQAVLHPTVTKPIASVGGSTTGALSFMIGGTAVALACSTLITGCAPLGNPATPAQQLYAGLGAYSAALEGATTYAEAPGADPAIVMKLDLVNKKIEPVAFVAQAYRTCAGGASGVQGKACSTFDFSPATLITDAQLLRDAALALQER